MANSVDNRVVQMEFENASFEKGIAQSLKSLEELHNKLDNGIDVKGLDDLSSKVDKISFSSTIDQVSQLESSCNGLVSVLKATVDELGGLGGVAVKALGGAAIGQIISGGIKRTENVENARFQLEGLKVAWDDVKDSIDYAVKDTAYGADEAARAASQFVASGVQLGNEMSTSLRSISGVAAMTNSTYEDTARIFTTIAGNGRLMTMQLNQLAMRGLNVAAIMAERWGMTEEEVREMVHKGEIDFRTFSDVMDETFGEHAKKANETFSGALANMKAALSRIGQDFITPWREMERQVFLGVKDMLNNIKAGFNEYVDLTEAASTMGIFRADAKDRWDAQFAGTVLDGHVQGSIISSFEQFVTTFGSRVQHAFNNIAESGVLSEFVQSFTWALTGVFNLAAAVSTGLVDIFESLAKALPVDFFANLLNPIGNIATSMANFIYPLLEAVGPGLGVVASGIENLLNAALSYIGPGFIGLIEGLTGGMGDLFATLKQGTYDFKNWAQSFENWTETLGLSEEEMARVRETAVQLGTAFRGFAGEILDRVVGGLTGLANAARQLQPVFEAIGNFILAVFEPAIRTLSGFFQSAATAISGFFNLNLGENLFGLTPDAIQNVADGINSAAEKIRASFNGVSEAENAVSKASSVVSAVFSKVTEVMEQMKPTLLNEAAEKTEKLGSVWNTVGTTISTVASTIGSKVSDLFSSMSDGLKGAKDVIDSFISSLSLSDVFVLGLAPALTALVGLIKTTLNRIFITVRNFNLMDFLVGPAVGEAINALTDSLKAMQTSLAANTILTLAAAIGILALSAIALSKVDAGALAAAVGALTGLTIVLSGSLVAMAKMLDGVSGVKALNSLSGTFLAMSAAIFVLAAAVKMLASIGDPVTLFTSVAALVAMMAALTGAMLVLSKFAGDAVRGGAAMMAMAVALLILAVPIKLLSTIPFSNLATGLYGVGVGLLAMTAALLLLSNFGSGKMLSSAMALLVMASALLAMSVSIIALSMVPFDRLTTGLIGFAVGLGIIVTALAAMSRWVNPSLSMVATLGLLSVMMLSMAAALALLAVIPMERMGTALLGFGVAFSVLVLGLMALSQVASTGSVLAAAVSITVISAAFVVLSAALIALSTIPLGNLASGLLAIAASMAIFVVAILALSKINALELIAISMALGGLVGGITTIAIGLATIAALPLDRLVASVAALAVVIGVLMASLALMDGMNAGFNPMMFSIMATALLPLAISLSIMGNIPIEGIASALGILAGVLLILGIAAVAIPKGALSVLAADMVAIAASAALAGLGVMAFAIALGVIAETAANSSLSIADVFSALAEGITSFLTSLASNAGQLVEAFVALGLAMLQALGSLIPQMVEIGLQLIVGLMQGIAAHIGEIASLGLEIIANLIVGIASGIGQLMDAGAQLITMFIVGIGDTLRANGALLLDAISSLISSIIGMAGGLIADGLEAIFGPNPVADWIRENADGQIAAAEEASERVHEAFAEKNADTLATQKDLMDDMAATTEAGADDIASAVEGAGDGIVEGLVGKMTDGLSDFNPADIVSGETDFSSLTSEFEAGGSETAEGFTSGSEEGLSQLTSLFQGKSQEAVQAAGSVDSSGAGSSVGSNFGAGIAAGMDAWIGPIAEKAAQMVREAKDAANSEQSAASPSKDMIKSGGWFGEGFYIGMGKWIVPISKRAENMVAQAKRPILEFASSTSSIFEALDFSDDPVITPVLDLSQVEAGAGGIQSILDANSTLRFSRLSPQFGGAGDQGYYYNNEQTTYSITLDWRAGQDANDVLNDLSAAIKARNMTGGRGKHGR